MSFHKVHDQRGFTLAELLIAIVLIGIIGTTFLVFFKSSFFNYLNLQKDATSFTQLDTQANRVSNVLRSTTDIFKQIVLTTCSNMLMKKP